MSDQISHPYEAGEIEVLYVRRFMFLEGEGNTKYSEWALVYRVQTDAHNIDFSVRLLLSSYLPETVIYRSLSHLLLTVTLSCVGHEFTLLEYMKSVVVQN
jgi:hypothetical protein